MSSHSGSQNKPHCVTNAFYVSVTMHKHNPIHRATFCLRNARIVLSIVEKVVLDLKSFDIPP